MVTKSDATTVRDLSLEAISKLSSALLVCKERGSQAEFERMRTAVAHAMGYINSGILTPIYAEFSDLDHLK